MRSIFAALIAATVLFTMTAQAGESSCKKISVLAGEAMTARQKGELLEDSLDRIGDGSKFARAMILKAYERPVAIAESLKTEAVNEFRNEAFRQCLNANS